MNTDDLTQKIYKIIKNPHIQYVLCYNFVFNPNLFYVKLLTNNTDISSKLESQYKHITPYLFTSELETPYYIYEILPTDIDKILNNFKLTLVDDDNYYELME